MAEIRDPSDGQVRQVVELPLAGGAVNVTRASQLCSAALWRLLTKSDPDDWKAVQDSALREIMRSPEHLAQAKQIAADMRARAAPMGPESVLAQVVPLKALYGLGQKSEQEWATFWGYYIDALDRLPAEALAEAIVQWNRTGDRFPSPGQLYKLARPEADRLYIAASRAKTAADWRDRHQPRQSAEEKAAGRQKLIDEGILIPDGAGGFRVNMGPKNVTPLTRPAESPQQMAQRLKGMAEHPPETI